MRACIGNSVACFCCVYVEKSSTVNWCEYEDFELRVRVGVKILHAKHVMKCLTRRSASRCGMQFRGSWSLGIYLKITGR